VYHASTPAARRRSTRDGRRSRRAEDAFPPTAIGYASQQSTHADRRAWSLSAGTSRIWRRGQGGFSAWAIKTRALLRFTKDDVVGDSIGGVDAEDVARTMAGSTVARARRVASPTGSVAAGAISGASRAQALPAKRTHRSRHPSHVAKAMEQRKKHVVRAEKTSAGSVTLVRDGRVKRFRLRARALIAPSGALIAAIKRTRARRLLAGARWSSPFSPSRGQPDEFEWFGSGTLGLRARVSHRRRARRGTLLEG